jgi:hypothetical protein
LDILTVLVDDVTENPFPVGGAQPQARAGIVVELARSQASNAAQAPVIELVGDQLLPEQGVFLPLTILPGERPERPSNL